MRGRWPCGEGEGSTQRGSLSRQSPRTLRSTLWEVVTSLRLITDCSAVSQLVRLEPSTVSVPSTSATEASIMLHR